MRLPAIFASALAVFAFQCGGQIDEQCPSAPNQSCVQEGKTCDFPISMCGTQTTATCTCKDGSFECPVHDCPIEVCPLDTYPGASCTSKGLQCESMQASECVDVPITCTCNGSTFDCAIPDCPPPPSCPPPNSITPGAACAPMGAQCNGPDFSQCDCGSNGIWECTVSIVDAGPPDAGGTDD